MDGTLNPGKVSVIIRTFFHFESTVMHAALGLAD